MGIRFACHGCGKPLNIKNELAGRRGVCPECRVRFRIPKQDAERSSPIETPTAAAVQGDSNTNQSAPTVSNAGHANRQASGVGEVSGRGNEGASQSGAVGSAAVLQQAPAEGVTAVADVKRVDPVDDVLNIDEQGNNTTQQASTQKSDDKRSGDAVKAAIDSLATDTSATWYVRPPSGGQYGPANGETLKQWIDQGRVAQTALLWRDGWPQWREAKEALPEICESLPNSGVPEKGELFAQEQVKTTTQTAQPATAAPFPAASQAEGIQVQDSSPDLKGSHHLGASRRKRSSRRVTMVAILATLAIGLVVTLVLVAARA